MFDLGLMLAETAPDTGNAGEPAPLAVPDGVLTGIWPQAAGSGQL